MDLLFSELQVHPNTETTHSSTNMSETKCTVLSGHHCAQLTDDTVHVHLLDVPKQQTCTKGAY